MSDTTPYSVPQEPGRWRAIGLAAIVHLALLAFLWVGIRWQSQTPVTMEAEIWDLQAKDAAALQAPTPPQPQPAPEKKPAPKPIVQAPPLENPNIALEQEKKKKEKIHQEEERQAKLKAQERLKEQEKLQAIRDQEKADQLAKKKKEDADKKRKQDAQDANLAAKYREDEMRRITAGSGGTGTAPKSQGMRGDAGYAGKIAAKIKSNTAFAVPPDLQENPFVEYDVQLLPDGSLRGPPRKVKSSGIPGFDEAVRRAIELSQPYPADKSGTVPSGFPVIHRPKEQ